ncbi:MAG: DNA repair protein RadC [Alphaproteobacteria bacterium]|nr:DNA repair protein RadC [Alphaproteobacteria bacterium]
MTKSNIKPDYLGHRERLRQRFLLSEGRDMADYELLELVLTIALPRRDVKPLAKALISDFGSFAGVINANKEELCAIDGIKENTVTVLKIINAALQRTSWQNLQSQDGPIILNIDSLIDYCRTGMCYSDVEEFRLIYLDSKLHVIGQETMQKGTINSVAIHPREVIKAAMSNRASAIIMVHNHPSGNVQPSKSDVAMTERIDEACESIGIRLLDHLVVSNKDYYSFAQHCLLKSCS